MIMPIYELIISCVLGYLSLYFIIIIITQL